MKIEKFQVFVDYSDYDCGVQFERRHHRVCYELILLNKYGCFSSVLEIEGREGLNLKSSVHCFSKSSLVFFQEIV